MKKISIVVPCYNEEDVIQEFYNQLKAVLEKLKEYEYDILFVNDGSEDNTLNLLKEINIQDKNTRIISFSRNFGKESAIYAGLENSIGDFTILMDADLQHPPKKILEMVKGIEEGYDVVTTVRKDRKGEPIIRSGFSKIFYRMMKKLDGINIKQGSQDFRIMTRQVVDSVLQLKEYNRFSKGIFNWVGYNVKYIEIENIKRNKGKTKWSFKKLFSYAIEGFVSFTTAPLKISTVLGVIISGLSLICALIIIFQTILFGKDVPGYASIITSILFMGGIQLLSIGILSEYTSKIYLEIKDRPKYIIKEKID